MALLIPNLRNYLLTITDLTDILGQKIRAGAIHQNDTYPYVIISLIVSDDNQTLNGSTDFTKRTVELKTVSLSYEQTETIDEIIRLNLNGFQQQLMGDLYINSTRKTNEYTFTDPPENGGNKFIFTRETIYDISYPIPDNVV